MITLYTFGPSLGLPDASPFVMKAEMLLKIAGLPYELNTGGFTKAPKGKLPYIKDGDTIVADSTLIRFYLEDKYSKDFDRNLSPSERGIAWAVEKMLEEHFYFAMVDARWLDDANFAKGPANFFNAVPGPMRGFVRNMVRSKVRKTLQAQGLGRHSKDDLARMAGRDIDAAAAVLGSKPYLMGDAPCGADATLFAFAAGALCPVFETPLRTAAEGHANLVAYVRRMTAQYYPELGKKAA